MPRVSFIVASLLVMVEEVTFFVTPDDFVVLFSFDDAAATLTMRVNASAVYNKKEKRDYLWLNNRNKSLKNVDGKANYE